MKTKTWLSCLLLAFVAIFSLVNVQAETTYGWDANGNMTSSLDDAGNSATYTYDGKNQLTQVERQLSDGSSIVIEYEYDWQRNRTAKIVNGVRTNYIVDSNRPLPVVMMEIDDNGQIIAQYTYGPTSYLPISQTRNGETYIYHYDGSDNVRKLTDSSGNVVAEYGYDSQGDLLFAIGNIENNFLFSGQQYDSDAGLYYHRERYRDTNTGRFTQMDQYSGNIHDPATLHKYNYSHNDPVNLSDPSGKFSIAQTMSAVNVMASLASAATTGYRIGQFATGEREASAKEIGFTVLIAAAGPAGGKLAQMLGNSRIAKNVCENVCNLLQRSQVIGSIIRLRSANSIRFTQSSINKNFSDGGSVNGLIRKLRTGEVSPNDLPPIRIFRKDGQIFSLDNRRLYAGQQAGVRIRTVGATQDEILREAWKFTTKNGGESIRVRGGR
ncbi:MAG: RHS repeat-associated core domain-containing protein [Candidatus Thiodiazotropha sp. (ex Troendleina suluensis)]|nr:RHS repeat-associated core domain-containing protein [Candidatus Thiodiazotropha sp. (ex Troendleina suluensis)]